MGNCSPPTEKGKRHTYHPTLSHMIQIHVFGFFLFKNAVFMHSHSRKYMKMCRVVQSENLIDLKNIEIFKRSKSMGTCYVRTELVITINSQLIDFAVIYITIKLNIFSTTEYRLCAYVLKCMFNCIQVHKIEIDTMASYSCFFFNFAVVCGFFEQFLHCFSFCCFFYYAVLVL